MSAEALASGGSGDWGRGPLPRSTGVVDDPDMATDPRTGTEILDKDTCFELLRTADVGRLAFVIGNEVEIFPVNFIVDGDDLVFRTAEGTKLAGVVTAAAVTFESDGYEPATNEAWSVVVKGVAERVEHFDQIYAAQELPLFPWNTSPKQWFVRLRHNRLSGRRFAAHRDHEPMPD